MNDSYYGEVILDPEALTRTTHELAQHYDLTPDEITSLARIIELFPRRTRMYFDLSNADIYADIPLADKFTFDIETDDLILFSADFDTFVDALIEMAMYLSGFSTKMGNPDAWVIDFTIGAWKPVKQRIKNLLNIPLTEEVHGVVGLRPEADEAQDGDPYPFRTLVSHFDQLSFQQMIMLAARQDVTVYFPPGTHPKVSAVYTHARRAIEEVAQNITIEDHQAFNLKLNNALRRIEQLFAPATLEPPSWIARLLTQDSNQPPSEQNESLPPDVPTPFETFIEQLFNDEDGNDF